MLPPPQPQPLPLRAPQPGLLHSEDLPEVRAGPVVPEEDVPEGAQAVGVAVVDMLPAGRYAPSVLTTSNTSTTRT